MVWHFLLIAAGAINLFLIAQFIDISLAISGFSHVVHVALPLRLAVSFLLLSCFGLFFYALPGELILLWMMGARKLIPSEEKKIIPILESVRQKAIERYPNEIMKTRLWVIDEREINAFAVGRTSVVLTRALVETYNEKKIAAVIAHELGHLYHGDSSRTAVKFGISLIGMLVLFTLTWFSGALNPTTDRVYYINKDEWLLGILIRMVVFIVLLPFVLSTRLVVNLIDALSKRESRMRELRADRFAVEIGLGSALMEFLHNIKDEDFCMQRGPLRKLFATHPPVILRIGQVERMRGL